MRLEFRRRRRLRPALTLALLLGVALPAGPALAQATSPEGRLRKLEGEVRALQRKVFPGGASFEPEIARPVTPTPAPGQPATSAVTDLLSRMDAIEAQIAQVTAQTEQNANRIAQIEARLGPVAPPAVMPGQAPMSGPPQQPGGAPPLGSAVPVGPAPVAPAAATPSAATPAAAMPAPPPQAGPVARSGGPAASAPAARIEAVRAIAKPQTADPADDEYSYGYRLWDAKFYPEAQQQLRLYLERHPKHSRVSFARNLLGRAYLEDGDAREAAKWFLQNYQADKAGARAPDSLLYLGRSMKALNDTRRACIALAEFSSTYAAEAAGRLKADYDATRQGLNCN